MSNPALVHALRVCGRNGDRVDLRSALSSGRRVSPETSKATKISILKSSDTSEMTATFLGMSKRLSSRRFPATESKVMRRSGVHRVMFSQTTRRSAAVARTVRGFGLCSLSSTIRRLDPTAELVWTPLRTGRHLLCNRPAPHSSKRSLTLLECNQPDA
jgi:hypothetical protein